MFAVHHTQVSQDNTESLAWSQDMLLHAVENTRLTHSGIFLHVTLRFQQVTQP